MMNRYIGKIVDIEQDGLVTVKFRCNDVDRIIRLGSHSAEVKVIDKRKITPQQRNMIWGLVGEIADWQGESKGQTNEFMKEEFLMSIGENPEDKFSLADISITEAREYQKFLIDFILENGIGTKYNLIDHVDDIIAYIYSCMIHKRCCVCGMPAELHHVDRIGMGRDRDDIIHIGMDALPLCRTHHTEAHTMTDEEFLEKHHLTKPIKIDKMICEIYGLRSGTG